MAYVLERMEGKGVLQLPPSRTESLAALGVTSKGYRKKQRRKVVDCGPHRQSLM